METLLRDLKSHVDVLNSNTLPSTGKRPRGTKTDRLKAVATIYDLLSKRNVRSALTAASVHEMVRAPPSDDTVDSVHLGWIGLANELLSALQNACDEALQSKATAKSGLANMKRDYMRCFRRVLKYGMQDGPRGVLCPIVLGLLAFAHDMLAEPAMRRVVADDLWQSVRDILADDANRAMLTPPFVRTWVDDCFQQLTGRGHMRHSSTVVSSLAGDVLQLLATPVEAYDVLTQSSRGISPSKMMGGDFGYAIICERCCLMLTVADSLSRRQARDLQDIAFRTLTLALTDHALDVCDSSALESIINICHNPILTCWMERKTHDAAVSLANILLLIAPNHRKFADGIRGRIRADITDLNSSAVLRAGKDIRDDYVSAVASCFSFREALEFACAVDAVEGHIIIWLRVAASIMSGGVLKRDTSILIDPRDVYDQCVRAAEAIPQILTVQNKSRGNSFIEIVYWACQVVNVTARTADRILTAGYIVLNNPGNNNHINNMNSSGGSSGSSSNNSSINHNNNLSSNNTHNNKSFTDTSKWSTLYQTLREVSSTLSYSGRTPGHSRTSDGLNSDESLIRSITLLSSLKLVDSGTLELATRASSSQNSELPFPLARILSPGKHATSLDVQLLRNLIARNGFTNEDGTGLRYRLVHALLSLCDGTDNDVSMNYSSPQLLTEASATVAGLVRGECGLSSESYSSTVATSQLLPSHSALQGLLREKVIFGLSIGSEKISNTGNVLVRRMRDQDVIWTTIFRSNTSKSSATEPFEGAPSVFDSDHSIVEHSVSSLSRHFAIPVNLSKKLELEILSKLTDAFQSLINTPQQGEGNVDHDEPMPDSHPGGHEKTCFSNTEASKKGLKILLFACNYLLVCLRHGLLNTAEGNGQEIHASNQFISLVSQLFSCLGNLDVSVVFEVPDLMNACVSVCCAFAHALEDEGNREKWSPNSPWRIACSALPGMLTKFASKLGESLIKILVSPAKLNRKRILALSEDRLEDPTAATHSNLPRKRGLRAAASTAAPAHKRRRHQSIGGVAGSQSSEGNGFPDDSDDELRNDEQEQTNEDWDSEDDFGDESLRTKSSQQSVMNGPKASGTNQEIVAISDLLKILVQQMPAAAETIFDCCVNGLNAIFDVERMLSPDGFERAALYSSLIDQTCIHARRHVWDVLFSVGSTPALVSVGKDVLKLGRYWKDLEHIHQDYVMFHVDPEKSKRKQFPLPNDLEVSRVVFLNYSRRFLDSIRTQGSARSTDYASKSEEVQRLVRGMVDVVEFFRLHHAFRMPRNIRMEYLKFGASAVLLKNEGILTDPELPNSDDRRIGIEEKVANIQSAMCKLMGDSEAIVRFTAARITARVFSSWQHYPMSDVEKIFAENLPPTDMCEDSNVVFGPRGDGSEDMETNEGANSWGLTEHEFWAKNILQKSFQKVGAKSKGLSTLVTLGEIAAAREDIIPFFFVQMSLRISQRSALIGCAYYIIVRICIVFGLKSPRRLYQAFSRVILPRLLRPPRAVNEIYSFPAALVLDVDQHRDGAVYDWLRAEQAQVLPHLLVQEAKTSLDLTVEFASNLDINAKKLLEDNVTSFVVIFPMQFSPGLHERGKELWGAINELLDGKIISLLTKKKDEVVSSLLLSTSGNFVCRYSAKSRLFDVERSRGFIRDTRSLLPPLYDPLIVASSINHMYGSGFTTSIVPKSVLRGSLFAPLRHEQTGNRVVGDFSSFVKECRKPNSSLLRCLFTISKALDPVINCQSMHSRLDAYFCVGLIWLMLDVHILLKPANERLLFYKLLSKGFDHIETASDASWLLLNVQQKLLTVKSSFKDFEVFDSDIGVNSEDREHLMDLETTRERQMYELVSSVTPTLVSVITNHASLLESSLRDSAHAALTRLLALCSAEKLWKVVVCNGAFPGGKFFKEARVVYQKAVSYTEGGTNRQELNHIFSSLKRFRGVYQQHDKSRSIASSLACLQELRLLLTESNVNKLAQKIESEAWFQSNGDKLPTATLIGSSIASLINLLRDVNCETGKDLISLREKSSNGTFHHGRLEEQVVRAIADVLNTLGLIQGQSFSFVHTDIRRRSVPSKLVTENYESNQDGIYQSMFWLVEILRSGHSITADAAMKSLVAILQTADGKYLFNSKREEFNCISALRGNDRRGSSEAISVATTLGYDPVNGEEVRLSSLPRFNDSRLWDLTDFQSKEEGGHEAWFRRVCAVLTSKCRSLSNQALAAACFASYRLCCDVFPYLMMDIICEFEPNARVSFSELLLKLVLKNPNAPMEILRILVHTLDVLCQVGLSVISEKGLPGWIATTSTGKLIIPPLYLLDISYSEATQAALRCGASFSAIRYAQLYVDHKVMEKEANLQAKSDGSSDRPRRSYVGRDPVIEDTERAAQQRVKPWIRRAMMQINEMDGIRAVAPSHTLSESAVSISNLDGEWSRSLAALGVASRSDEFLSNASHSSHATPKIQGVDLRREAETLQALIGIGNLNVATNYWDGLLNKISKNGLCITNDQYSSDENVIQRMNDLRYAAAWKLEHWETPPLITAKEEVDPGTNDSFCGFHHALYRMLHFVKTDRLSELPQALSRSRSQVLNNLCRDNAGVSAQSIFETAAQLRVFHVIEKTSLNTKPSSKPNSIESAGWSLGCTPQRGHNPMTSSMVNAHNIPTANSTDRLSNDLEILLGGYFGIEDFDSVSVIPSRDAFTWSILVEDLPVVFIRCLGKSDHVAQAAATASARILFKGESGAWARSACCLGTPMSSILSDAPRIHKIAWKLQECRLKWAASDDARTKKQALAEVKETILSLGGKFHDGMDSNASGSGGMNSVDSHRRQHSLIWESTDDSDLGRLGFLRAEACRLAANWSLDMKTHEPMDLFDTYLEPGLTASQASEIQKCTGRAHFAMASFADVQISNINSYRRSRKYEQTVSSVKDAEEHVARLRKMKKERQAKGKSSSRRRSRLSSEASGVNDKNDKVGRDLEVFINQICRQLILDKSRLEKLNETYKRWQVLACKHFAACLRDGNTHDLRAAFRMVALWLDSGDMRDSITRSLISTDQNDLGGDISDSSSSRTPVEVPVDKLLPLSQQLFSRLNFSDKSLFQRALISTITEMAGKYPAYCLWQLLALTNATRTSSDEKMSSLYRGDTAKKNAATEIFRRLESKHGDTMREMKTMADAYISLSQTCTAITNKDETKKIIDMGRMSISRVSELHHVAVPTVALPMRPSHEYCQRLPYIQGFERRASVCNGLSHPVRIKCLGSDGVLYQQMVKGKDDLRGDAVMEQMFTILNHLLERDREASKRNLYIRTYRIIPITPFIGIMQFVRNTKQFKELLIDKEQEEDRSGKPKPLSIKKSLHDRYRPNDMRHIEVLGAAFQDYRKYKTNTPRRLVLMRQVWRKLYPVFRYFFIEQWPDAAEWFIHQMNYSRSVAVMSIVGFILGLGDRHLSNILVDVHTAEIVHIDFGVAFEQGKLLTCPEHMPFRLTRDLVDGFGVAGVEGVFRKSCEITLSVMRRHKDVLRTIVEVLLHDPMFNWALTPEEVLREDADGIKDGGAGNGGGRRSGRAGRGYHGDNEEEISLDQDEQDSSIEAVTRKLKRDAGGSRDAQRALNRISEKLDGLEGTERLSVEAHVARLIDEAQAFHVIAPVFPGWNPWL